ncbi:MAG: chalcone isomerase family protein [Alphaproteobacteria bacterium]|jgi:hypothetical protein|nr:chalcone isomerase family protein [Alphaproteobacteria bacterium]
MRKAFIALVATTALLASAWAAARPSELSDVIAAPKPYGTATLTWLFLTAYEASLWTDARTWSMDSTFALVIVYRMSFTREELVERTVEEMARLSPPDAAARERLSRALRKVFPDVKAGDRITALHIPGRPVAFFHNGAPTSQIADPDFADPFFGIWLSPQTSEPSVRNGLLRSRS